MRAKTIEASPRGPNQPTKSTVALSIPEPMSAIATGSMRTTVKLSTAYTTMCQVQPAANAGMMTEPKTNHAIIDARPQVCST